jgi:hypothetical protein
MKSLGTFIPKFQILLAVANIFGNDDALLDASSC